MDPANCSVKDRGPRSRGVVAGAYSNLQFSIDAAAASGWRRHGSYPTDAVENFNSRTINHTRIGRRQHRRPSRVEFMAGKRRSESGHAISYVWKTRLESLSAGIWLHAISYIRWRTHESSY